jgi:hypothetical protein
MPDNLTMDHDANLIVDPDRAIDWRQDLRRYLQLIRTMERLGVLAELVAYVKATPPTQCKYRDNSIMHPAFDTNNGLLHHIVADMKDGTVTLPVLVAIIRVQGYRFTTAHPSHHMGRVNEFFAAYRIPMRRIYGVYVDGTGGVPDDDYEARTYAPAKQG